MRAKKYLGIAIMMSVCLGLTGCGESFPDLTEEEYDQTVEFAVGLLMKYSNNGQNKLTYVDTKEVTKQREKEAAKAKEEEKKEQEKVTPKPEPVTVPQPQAASTEGSSQDEATSTTSTQDQNDSSMALSSNEGETQEESAIESSNTGEIQEDPDAIVISSEDNYEISDDIFLTYDGYSVASSYPESSKSYVINADKGKKLLILRFDLYNASDSDKNVDLLKKNILFQVILNGKNLGYTPVTFLPNDLSSYVGTIDSRAHESLVVLTEIDQNISTQIQTIGLIVTINGADQKVNLR